MALLSSRLSALLNDRDPEVADLRLAELARIRAPMATQAVLISIAISLVAAPKVGPWILAGGCLFATLMALARFFVIGRPGGDPQESGARSGGSHERSPRAGVGRGESALRTERTIVILTALLWLYSATLIALPMPISPGRGALLAAIGVAAPIGALRALASSPRAFMVTLLAFTLGSGLWLLQLETPHTLMFLAGFALLLSRLLGVTIDYLDNHRAAIVATLQATRMQAQQWALFDRSPLGIMLTHGDRITRSNPVVHAWFESVSDPSVLRINLARRLRRTVPRLDALIARAQARIHGHRSIDLEVVLDDGKPACLGVRVCRFDPMRPEAGLLWTLSDRSAEWARRKSLERDVLRDALTGALNRRGLMRHLTRRLERDLGVRPVAVLYLDLNGFKPLNDRHGHAFGDRVLCTVTERLRRVVRPTDLLARPGGDEFVLVLDPIQDARHAAWIAERVSEVISDPMMIEGVHCGLRAAIGVACAPDGGTDAETLLARADAAMFEVKRASSGDPLRQPSPPR